MTVEADRERRLARRIVDDYRRATRRAQRETLATQRKKKP